MAKLEIEIWQTNAGDYIAEVVSGPLSYTGFASEGSTEHEALEKLRESMRRGYDVP